MIKQARFGRRGLLLAATVIGVLVLATGIAYATIPGDHGVIHGCYANDGQLRVIDPTSANKNESECRSSETAIEWSQQGPKGDPGAEE